MDMISKFKNKIKKNQKIISKERRKRNWPKIASEYIYIDLQIHADMFKGASSLFHLNFATLAKRMIIKDFSGSEKLKMCILIKYV